MAVALAEFERVLGAFLGADNTARESARTYLRTLQSSKPDTLLLSLLQVLRTSRVVHLRSLAAVLTRKALFTEDQHVWSKTSKGVQGVLKSELLAAIQSEPEADIRRLVCDTVGEVGQMVLESEAWPELLSSMFTWVTSEVMELRMAALAIFYSLALYLAENLTAQFPTFVGIFHKCFVDPKSPNKVKVATLKAAVSIMIYVDNVLDLKPFQALVPHFITLLTTLINSNDEQGANLAVSILIDLADDHPSFWRGTLDKVLPTMLALAGNKRLNITIRQLALEFCIALSEKKPAMLRKLPSNAFLKQSLPVIFGFILEIEDDVAKWDSRDDPVNQPCTNYVVGREAVQRVGEAIGAKTFLPIVFPIIGTFLASSSWQHKHTALMALSEIVHMVPQEIEQLKGLLAQIIPFVADPDIRVQYAALNAIGMVSMDHQPIVQLHSHETIIPAIRAGMKSPSQRVRAHAAGALVNFLGGAFDELMAEYVEPLLGDLFTLLQTGPTLVTEHAMNALAVLADTCPHEFGRLYDRLMPVLKDLITRCTSDKALRRVRGRAIECIGILGGCVPVAKFKADAIQVMQLMSNEQSRKMDAADPQRSCMWTTWGRIAKAMGAEFARYLPTVMPALLEAAREDPLVTQMTEEQAAAEADDSGDSDDSEVDTYQKGKVVLRVRTAAVEDKQEAIRILSCFAAGLKGAFAPHVAETAKAILPALALEGEVYDDVKAATLSALPAMLESLNEALTGTQRSLIKTLLETFLSAIFDALPRAEELDLIMTFVQTIKMGCEAACRSPPSAEAARAAAAAGVESLPIFAPALSVEQLTAIVKQLKIVMQASLNRRAQRRGMMTVAAEDYDDEAAERVAMEDAVEHELQYHCFDCISSLFKTHGALMLGVFQLELLDKVMQMTHPVCLAVDRKHGVFLIDDVIEYGGPGAAQHLPAFMPILATCSDSTDAGLAQASVYGLGVAAATMGDAFRPHVADAVNALVKVVNKPMAKESPQHKVHDNAVSSLGKIMLCQKVAMLKELVEFWLSKQPLTEDDDESRVVTRQLCTRIDAGCAHTLAPANLPKVLHTFAFVVANSNKDKQLCTKALAAQILTALKQINAKAGTAVVGAAFAKLEKGAQTALSAFMRDPSVAVGHVAASPPRAPGTPSGSGSGGGVGSPMVPPVPGA